MLGMTWYSMPLTGCEKEGITAFNISMPNTSVNALKR